MRLRATLFAHQRYSTGTRRPVFLMVMMVMMVPSFLAQAVVIVTARLFRRGRFRTAHSIRSIGIHDTQVCGAVLPPHTREIHPAKFRRLLPLASTPTSAPATFTLITNLTSSSPSTVVVAVVVAVRGMLHARQETPHARSVFVEFGALGDPRHGRRFQRHIHAPRAACDAVA